jgi:hypothetical protein
MNGRFAGLFRLKDRMRRAETGILRSSVQRRGHSRDIGDPVSGGTAVKRNLGLIMGLMLLVTMGVSCSASPPTEKQALGQCQDLAKTKMRSAVGNPRYRNNKTQIKQLETGPENYKFAIKGEYFYKGAYSGDSELRFTCTVSKALGADQWTTDSFESICIGGCS